MGPIIVAGPLGHPLAPHPEHDLGKTTKKWMWVV